jgi:hypothetical protein
MEKRQPLQQMLLGKVVICLQKTVDPCLSPCTSINSKWIKYLNIRPETLKFTQEREGNTLEAIGISRIQPAQQLREGINKWDYMKFKSCPTKEMVSKLKMLLLYIRQGTDNQNIQEVQKTKPLKNQ